MSELAPNDVSPNVSAPGLFKEALDRTDTVLSNSYMPWANVVLVASDEVVRRATENRPVTLLQRRWTTFPDGRGQVDYARFRIDRKWELFVSLCGTLWLVGRRQHKPQRVQGLAFLFGPMPVCAPTSKAAKRLAEYYHVGGVAQGGGILWVDVDEPTWW
jgi:hypothetical protein